MAKADELKAKIGLGGPPLERIDTAPPAIPDHQMVRRIGSGSYGDVWLARNAVGTWRAVKIVYRAHFKDARPYEREFSGIQKYEPISRTNDGLVDVLQLGRNSADGYFYYVMELADDAGPVVSPHSSVVSGQKSDAAFNPEAYVPKTLGREIQQRGRLPIEECITLGLTLNFALGHLHRSGLIHRDVKPSNIIFVNGVPKLADIGLVTELAEAQSFVGTEGFIPPEGPNSPQADIYALGKVLYEASMGKDRQEFPEPRSGLGVDADSKALMELNAVLLRACAPNPKERYQSAEEMNADLALLHSGKSVQDKHALERRLKITKRVAVAMVAVLVLAAFPYYLAIKEKRQATTAANNERLQRQKAEASEKKARAEAAKSEQVASFLRDMLNGVGPSVAKGRDVTILREILDKTAERVGTDLTNQPEVEAVIRETLCDVYGTLGLYPSAEEMGRKALALAQSGEAKSGALNNLGVVLWHESKLDEAEAALRQAVAMRKSLFGANHAGVGESLYCLSCVLLDSRRFADAEQNDREALRIFRQAYGDESRRVASGLAVLAAALFKQGKVDEGEKLDREVVALWKRLVGPEDAHVASTLNNLGMMLLGVGKPRDAEAALREALAIDRKILGKHPQVANILLNLGALLNQQNRFDDALLILREALAMDREVLPSDHPHTAASLKGVAVVLTCQEKYAEAEPLMRESLTIYEKRAPDDLETLTVEDDLGDLLVKQKDFTRAEPFLLSGYEGLRQREARIPAEGKPQLRKAIERLVQLYELSARSDQAGQWRQRLAEFDQAEAPKKPTATSAEAAR